MKSENIEYLFYVISRHDKGFLTAEEIALESGNSTRKIFYWMNELKACCLSNGCKLISVKGKGYYIEVEDQQLFNDAKKRLEIRFRNSDIKEDGYYHDFDMFVTTLLNNNKLRSISEVAQSMWVSETRAASIVKNASNVLSYYNISLEKKDGFYVLVGQEINIRVFILRFVNDNNQITLNIDAGYTAEQLKYLQQCLMKYNVLIKNHLTVNVALYLSLACSRNADGCIPDLSMFDVDLISDTDEYRCAAEIMKAYSDSLSDVSSEIFALALILLCNEQYYGKKAKEPKLIAELTGKYCTMFTGFLDGEGIPLSGDENVRADLYSSFIPMAYQQHFQITEISDYNEYRWEENLRNSFLPIHMVFDLGRIFGFPVKRTTMINIARFINITINNTHYPLKRLNIAVCSSKGWLNARMLCDEIGRLFTPFIEECRPYELYQLSGDGENHVDCVIGDFSELLISGDMKYLEVRYPVESRDMMEIVSFLADNAFDIQALLSSFLPEENCRLFADYEIESLDGFADMIAHKWGRNQQSREEMRRSMNTLSHYFTRSSIIYFLSCKDTAESFAEYYSLAKPLRIDNRKISDIFVMSADFGNDPVVLKLVSNMLSAVINDMERPKHDLYGYLRSVTTDYIIKKNNY